jgi:GTP-binding protein Era
MAFKSGYVAIVGQPNVGKSTLLNSLIGEELAVVTPKPQTTRHRITGILNTKNAQIIFLDTPGFHQSQKPLNQVMMEVIDQAIADADVVCLMIEPDSQDPGLDRALWERARGAKTMILVNKADTVDKKRYDSIASAVHEDWGAKEVIVLSALKGDGVAALIDAITERLPEGPAYYPEDQYTNHNLRFLAAEAIREQLFLQMHQEIPYSVAVKIEEFKEPKHEGDLVRIRAAIVVDKESQKGMVIGRGGAKIKEIGRRARIKIEGLVGAKVYLELFVKVEENWTKNTDKIRELISV